MIIRLLLLTSVSALLLFPHLVAAHSWYPKHCCDDMDCFPADKVSRLADGTLELSKGPIRVRVARTSHRGESGREATLLYGIAASASRLRVPAHWLMNI